MPAERFRRRMMGGYDPAQVDAALEARDERLQQLEREAQQLAKRVIETEKRVRSRIGGLADASGAVGSLGRRLDEIGSEARRRAVRLRLTAREAVQVAERGTELSRLREELGVVVSELAAFAGIQLGADDGGGADGSGAAEESAARAPGGGRGGGAAPEDGIYSGPVEVEVGPLRDFAQLTSFEDAVASIEAASEVAVNGFSAGRATFSMRFAQPVDLVRELERRAPFGFSVREAGSSRVVLDVAGTHDAREAA